MPNQKFIISFLFSINASLFGPNFYLENLGSSFEYKNASFVKILFRQYADIYFSANFFFSMMTRLVANLCFIYCKNVTANVG